MTRTNGDERSQNKSKVTYPSWYGIKFTCLTGQLTRDRSRLRVKIVSLSWLLNEVKVKRRFSQRRECKGANSIQSLAAEFKKVKNEKTSQQINRKLWARIISIRLRRTDKEEHSNLEISIGGEEIKWKSKINKTVSWLNFALPNQIESRQRLQMTY